MYKILKRGYYYGNAHEPEEEFLPTSYPTEEMAYMAAELSAFEAAQELNFSVFFAVDEDQDDFDFVVRCWDGDDYQVESRYKVVEEN